MFGGAATGLGPTSRAPGTRSSTGGHVQPGTSACCTLTSLPPTGPVSFPSSTGLGRGCFLEYRFTKNGALGKGPGFTCVGKVTLHPTFHVTQASLLSHGCVKIQNSTRPVVTARPTPLHPGLPLVQTILISSSFLVSVPSGISPTFFFEFMHVIISHTSFLVFRQGECAGRQICCLVRNRVLNERVSKTPQALQSVVPYFCSSFIKI